ncbi:MAG TPA: thiamine pyrophosphate-dependent enzyme [Thermomicrobiaceae bacterium]|nr:thiamine pyrophosphate-dependent enzyme [Thermomicrobiaceae bacterium]
MASRDAADRDLRESLFRTATTIRRFEETVADLVTTRRMEGVAHLSIGQEAVASAVCAALRPDDTITSTHRGHGHLIAKGGDLERMFAELLGRETGYCHGRGGSMHIADLALGILGANGIVGAGIPLAVGAGYAHARQGTDRVSVAFFGDGAVNIGAFHEGLNMAALWQLPVVFVCENNLYASSVAQSHHQRQQDIARRAAGYGIPDVTVDGNDALAVHAAAVEAVARARSGGGPTLIVASTYRHEPHLSGYRDDRPAEEKAAWLARDPLVRLARDLDAADPAGPERRRAIEEEIDGGLERALAAAEAAPRPDPAELTRGVYGPRPSTPEAPPPGTRELGYQAALNEAMTQAILADPRVTYIGEDLERHAGAWGIPEGRVRDTPIAEEGFTGLAIGAALCGERTVADIMFMDFTAIAMDQIVNQAAKIRYMLGGEVRVPVVIRAHVGGGAQSAAQHSQSLEAWFAHVPGLTVVYPSNPYDAKGLLLAALADENPTLFVESRQLMRLTGPVPEAMYRLPIGRAAVARHGSDVTVIGVGPTVPAALAAAEELAAEGISVEVVDPRTLQPLDVDALAASARRTGRVVVAHHAVRFGGIGAEIAAQLTERCFGALAAPVVRLGAPFAPAPFAGVLEQTYQPDQAAIAAAVRELMGR